MKNNCKLIRLGDPILTIVDREINYQWYCHICKIGSLSGSVNNIEKVIIDGAHHLTEEDHLKMMKLKQEGFYES